ncbi:MAG TPA: SPASM domain-containing protein, partial [Verrucomicrobiae bacterium]|nr:SPASM domain-containing protein [Verrucomicrobiae bacterium]
GAESGKEFNFGIVTNGTLLDDRIIEFLKEKKFSVVVSFDGPQEVQDTHRPFKKGDASSFEHLLPRVKKLLAAMPKTSARATLYGDTDPKAVVQAIRDAGFPGYYLVEAARSAYDRPEQAPEFAASSRRMAEYAQWEAKEILGAIKARDRQRVLENKTSVFSYTITLLSQSRKCHSCGIGKAYVVVSTRGEIYPCHGFVDMPKYQIGHIESPLLRRNEYLKSPITDPASACSKCWARNLCGGGCKVDHFGASGSMFEPNETSCNSIRSRVETAIDLRCRLDDADVSWLQDQGIVPKPRFTLDFIK